MGMDLYGLEPQVNKSMNEFPTYAKYQEIDWKDREKVFKADEKLRDKYWKEHDDYEEANVGVYFRNNVWFWRPLWTFICDNCDHILTEDQIQGGTCNDGTLIEHDQAEEIHNVIVNTIGKKQIIKMQCEYEDIRKETEKKNKGKKLGDDGYDFNANYPFDAENVLRFAEFCKESGGFEIW